MLMAAMEPVSTAIVIGVPREEVFDYLQDIANHPAFTDHFLVDWRLTRERSAGAGAGARFRVKAPGNRFAWADATLAEVAPPHRIVEVGRTGKGNRVPTLAVWELLPAAGGATRVTRTFETRPAVLSDRLLEHLGARSWVARKQRRALRRLRDIVERQRRARREGGAAGAPAPRVTVAGG
jgi:uncharacterized protein YndB with AHSA1/START domain